MLIRSFGIMVYGITNQWCSLMDQTFLNHLDYAEDLEAFYEQGAGYKINYEMAAVLLQDIYSFMKKFTTGETSVVANLRFGHAETTLPLMTLLGYGDRTKLLASWNDDQINSRGFRTSILSPPLQTSTSDCTGAKRTKSSTCRCGSKKSRLHYLAATTKFTASCPKWRNSGATTSTTTASKPSARSQSVRSSSTPKKEPKLGTHYTCMPHKFTQKIKN